MKLSAALTIAIATTACINLAAVAGPNDFFGGNNIGGASDNAQGAQVSPKERDAAAQMPAGPPPAEYTSDEKRVQKKYKANMKSAQDLVRRGESMSHSRDDKIAKKGRILKEIGEKRIAELKANNPFPEIAGRDPKKVN